MQSCNALSLTPDGNDWLMNSRQWRVLHVFDSACNLMNECREILSIVTPRIGNGPFNLVLEDDINFSEHLNLQSSVDVSPTKVILGDLNISMTNALSWSPRPDWEMLHARRDNIAYHLKKLSIANHLTFRPHPIPLYRCGGPAQVETHIAAFSSALASGDIPSALKIIPSLAGLGAGLTPSGDDFLMGAIYATWVIHPGDIACVLAKEIANTAAPLTTSLSAAWLRSAGRGDAGALWHTFFYALVSGEPFRMQETAEQILSVGETSGADALAGFFITFMSRAKIPS